MNKLVNTIFLLLLLFFCSCSSSPKEKSTDTSILLEITTHDPNGDTYVCSINSNEEAFLTSNVSSGYHYLQAENNFPDYIRVKSKKLKITLLKPRSDVEKYVVAYSWYGVDKSQSACYSSDANDLIKTANLSKTSPSYEEDHWLDGSCGIDNIADSLTIKGLYEIKGATKTPIKNVPIMSGTFGFSDVGINHDSYQYGFNGDLLSPCKKEK